MDLFLCDQIWLDAANKQLWVWYLKHKVIKVGWKGVRLFVKASLFLACDSRDGLKYHDIACRLDMH